MPRCNIRASNVSERYWEFDSTSMYLSLTSLSGKVVVISHPPLNPPASGGKYFCICIRYTRSIHLRREKTIFSLPARGEGWGGGILFAIPFSTGSNVRGSDNIFLIIHISAFAVNNQAIPLLDLLRIFNKFKFIAEAIFGDSCVVENSSQPALLN